VTFDNFVESVELGDIRMMIKLDVHVTKVNLTKVYISSNSRSKDDSDHFQGLHVS
jgi:hypothetical protein